MNFGKNGREIIESLMKMGCMTKDECAIISDEKYKLKLGRKNY